MNVNDNNLIKLSKEYLKSYFSINSYIGCTINCGYCFLAPIKIVPMRPIKVIDELKLVDDMINDKYFKVNKTVISLNNRTDPFISKEVKCSTFKLLDIMDKKGLKNIVTITTKGLLTKNDSKILDNYENIKIVIIVTYNGIPKEIQPIDSSIQEQTMKNIANCTNVILLHQFRPIMFGINDDEKTIKKILAFSKKYCDATIYQGIRVNNYIKNRLMERNYEYTGKFDIHKQKSQSVDNIFLNIKKADKSYQIFEHTSCALSYIFQIPDYNIHYEKYDCTKICANYYICQNKDIERNYILELELEKIGIYSPWKLVENLLIIDGSLTDEQKSYIKHILHLQVKANVRENTYSEKLMEGKNENKNIF